MVDMIFNWANLRPLDGSLQFAFEELCCQLAKYEIPGDYLFVRKGTPDAGVECFCVYPDGTERGWQAKFFDAMGQSQWRQLDNSVRTALEKHPHLVTYTICLPLDRPDPRIKEQKSFFDRWNDHTTKWQGWATEKGMQVQFDYWGNHEILERLSLEEHRGRFFFWFGTDRFSDQWFQVRLSEAIRAAGPRYTPEIHVELPVSQLFDALGRTDKFVTRVKTFYRGMYGAFSRLRIRKWGEEVSSVFAHLQSETKKLLDFILTTPFTPPSSIPWSELENQSTIVVDAAEFLLKAVEKSTQEIRKEEKPDKEAEVNKDDEEKRTVEYYAQKFLSEVLSLRYYSSSSEAKVSNQGQALLVGEAGIGKIPLNV